MLPEQAHIAWKRLQEDLALAATLGVKQLPIDHIRKRMNDLEAGLPLQISFISEGTGQAEIKDGTADEAANTTADGATAATVQTDGDATQS